MENMDISSSKDDSIAMDYDVRSSNSMDESVVTTSPLKKKISYRISFSDVAFTDIMDGGNKKHASNSRYAQLVLDHTFSRQFKNNDIFDEYIRYMEYCPWYSHSKSVIGFLYDMIIHTKNDHTKMNKIFEKVLETELFINTKSLDSDSDNILTLYGFVYSIVTIRPLWFDYYRISPDFDQFWVDVGNNHFRIKADWILKFPDYHNRRLPIINGFIDLEENDFVTLFLPVFYRCLLTDLYNYLIYIECYPTNFTNEIIAIEFMERFEPDTDTVDFFATFPLDNSLPNYYDFSVAYGFPTKTAEDASIKLSTDEYNRTLYKLSLSRSSVSTTSTSSSLSLSNTSKNITTTTTTTTPPVLSSSSTTYQQAIQNFERSNMPDLEDLINPKLNYLPKCLSNLMTENGEKRKKMKYHDRLNLTTYLADMDYGKEEIVQAFPDDANSIAANFTTYKRKREKDGDKKFNTFYCTAIMNKSPDNRDDHCRCPYIENTDYTKRLSSSSSTVNEDQFTTYKRYRDSCYSNIISKGSFSHPLNYVSIQVNK